MTHLPGSGICVAFLLAAAALGCATTSVPSAGFGRQGPEGAARPDGEPKTLTMAFEVFPASPGGKLKGGGRGNVVLHWIFNAYLTGLDKTGTPQPIIAERVPSLEHGTWTVHSDNSMETVWTIRPSALWQDGRPVVSRDFVLAWRVINDRDMPVSGRTVESLISDIETPDDRTLVLRWKQLYIGANEMNGDNLPPLPSHLIEDLYRNDKQAFVDSEFWTTEYVGSGPFKVEQWDPAGSTIVTSAHPGYALGRPNIDSLRLVFISDQQTMMTNILAGTVDVAVSPAIRTPAAITLKESWEQQGSGKIAYSPGLMYVVAFQLRDVPNVQRALKDRSVRQALVSAIDKQAAADAMPRGVLMPAHYPMALTDPLYLPVERAVPKHRFDPPLAERLLDAAGWRKGADGIRHNAAGDRLDVPNLSSPGENELEVTIIGDYWKRVGVEGAIETIPAARALDSEFTSSYRGASYNAIIPQWNRIDWISREIPSPATRYAGRNKGGYASPETDELVSRVQTTLDLSERERYVVELMRIWMDDVGFFPHLFKPAVIAAARGISGYDTEVWPAQNAHTWNIHRWRKA